MFCPDELRLSWVIVPLSLPVAVTLIVRLEPVVALEAEAEVVRSVTEKVAAASPANSRRYNSLRRICKFIFLVQPPKTVFFSKIFRDFIFCIICTLFKKK